MMHFANPGPARRRERLPGALREPDRRRRPRRRRAAAREDPPVRPAPHEARGAAASCRRAPTRCSTSSSTRRSAPSTTPSASRRARAWPRSSRRGAEACSPRSRRCCACARPRATRRSSPGSTPRRRRRSSALVEALEDAVADGHKALVFSQWTSLLDLRRAAPRARRASASRASTARRAIAAPSSNEFQAEAGPAGHARVAQGGRHRPQPHRGRSRLPARSVVEPRRRGSGRRPRAPHRAGPAGDGLPHGREGHRRGADPRAAGARSARLADVALGEASQAGGITREELLALLD